MMICVRWDARQPTSLPAGENVRVHPELGFLNANQWWWRRVAQDCEQAEITQASVGQPRGRNGKIAFGKHDLNAAAFHKRIEISDVILQAGETFQDCLLGFGRFAQAAQEKSQIGKILLQPVVAQIRFLRLAKDGVSAKGPLPVDAPLFVVVRQIGDFRKVLRVTALREDGKLPIERKRYGGCLLGRVLGFG